VILLLLLVTAGLVPAIHVFVQIIAKDVDPRDKPGGDERTCCSEDVT